MCHVPEQLLGLRPAFASQSLGAGALVVTTCTFSVFFFTLPTFLQDSACLPQLLFIRPLSLANLCIPGVLSFLCICCVPLHFSILPRRVSGHSISEQPLLNSWSTVKVTYSNLSRLKQKERQNERERGESCTAQSSQYLSVESIYKGFEPSHAAFLKASQAKSIKRQRASKVATHGRWCRHRSRQRKQAGCSQDTMLDSPTIRYALAPKKQTLTTWWLGTE